MDVVRTVVEAAGGKVEVESRVKLGTVVRIRLPLTVAILSALVVQVAGARFCIAQAALAEVVWVSSVACVERRGEASRYRLREELLPVIFPGEMLGAESLPQDGFYLAVLEADGCRFGLAVEDIDAPEEIVVRPLAPVLREAEIFSGETVLGYGGPALILNAGALAARAGLVGKGLRSVVARLPEDEVRQAVIEAQTTKMVRVSA